MSTILNFLIIIVSAVALVKGVGIFISSTTKLAKVFKISGYTLSFFLVAIGTSLPETVVAITAAANKDPLLAFGNALGSNIALVTLVIAIPAVFTVGVSTRTIINSKDIYYAALFSVLPLLLVVDGTLTKVDGTILLLGYGIYSTIVLKRKSDIKNILERSGDIKVVRQLLIFIVSLAILLGASELIVQSAISLSIQLSLGLGFIGLTITALGTSIPEIAFTVAAIKNDAKENILGDVIGSVVANSTLVLGLAAIVYPINIHNSKVGAPTIFFLIFSILLFLHFAKTKQKLDTFEGIILLILYCIFVVTEYLIASGGLAI